MKMSHRTIHNALFNMGSWAFPILFGFVFTPYIVKQLGHDAYGVLTLVWSVIGYLAFLDLGLGTAVTKFVSENRGRDSVRGVNDTVGAAVLMTGLLGLVGALLVAAAAGPLTHRWLSIPDGLMRTAYYAFLIGAGGFLVSVYHQMFVAIPRGLNRYDVTSVTMVANSCLQTGGAAALLYFGYGLIEIVILNTCVPLAALIVYAAAAKRVYPGLSLRPRFSRSALRLVKFGLYTLLGRFAYVISRYADRLVIGIVLGTSSVTYYAVPMVLVTRLSGLPQRMGNVIFPAVSELQGRRRDSQITDIFLTATRLMVAVSTAICVPLIVYGRRLLELWMSPEFAESAHLVMLLITLSVYLDQMTNISSFVVEGLGKPQVTGVSSIVRAAVFLALLYPLTGLWGIDGAALATLLSCVAVSPVFVWYSCTRVLRVPVMRLLSESLARPVLLGLVFWLGLRLVPQDPIDNLLMLLTLMGATGAAYLALCLPTGILAPRERQALWEYVRVMTAKGALR